MSVFQSLVVTITTILVNFKLKLGYPDFSNFKGIQCILTQGVCSGEKHDGHP